MMSVTTFRLDRVGGLGALICGCFAVAGAVQAQEYPRAEAAAAAQRIATAADRGMDALWPVIRGFAGARGELATASALGSVFFAFDAETLAEEYWRRAQGAAVVAGDNSAAATAAATRCEIALTVGDYDLCERLSRDLLVLAQRSGLPFAQASAEEYLGVLERRHGRLEAGAAHQQHALALRRTLGDEAGIAVALSNLGTIARDRGDFAEALSLHLQSLAIRERSGDDRLALTYRNLALLYTELGDDKATRDYFVKALAVARIYAKPAYYSTVLGSYARFLNDVREFEPAEAAADEELALGAALGNRPTQAFAALESGRALLGLTRIDAATARLQDALALGRELDQREIVARSRAALAEAALERGDRKQARQLLDETLADPQTSQWKPQLAHVYALLERLASADGDIAVALDYAHRQAALREELLGTSASRRLSALESQYAKAGSEAKLALATTENQLQNARLQQEQVQRRYGLAALTGLTLALGMLIWRFFGVRRLNHALAIRNAEIEAKRTALSEANRRLEQHAAELYQAAITDSLTGVFNRGHLMRQLDALITDCVRDGRELAVLLIDFDHFKQINDARGHLFGDRVLVAGVLTLRQWLEPGDLLGRYGGEEFIAAVAGRDVAGVRALAERLRIRVAETLAASAPELRTIATISIGVALLSQLPKPVRLEALVDAADKAVYMAKENGRNRVMNYVA